MKTVVLVVAGLVLVPAASHAAGASGPAAVQVPPKVAAMADAPKPGAGATKKSSIGKGKAAASTANAAGDDDSFWVEEIDIDGDGTTEQTDVLWDDEDKVLFLSASGDFKCKNGGTGTGDMLIAVNGKGNSRGRPAGSGFYVVTLDEDECAADDAGSYGCKFDARGVATACGVVIVDDKNDDITIATAMEG
jgi:hypothetical protein